MHLFFLIPLITAVAAGYIFKNSADEMAYLAGLVTLIGMILSLVLAPWQLQVLVLMVVLIGTRRLLLQNQSKMQLEDNQEE